MVLETPRLILREMVQADYADLAGMLQDETVMAAYEHRFADADIQQWLKRQQQRYAVYGFGLWAAVLKESGEMI